MDEKSTCTRCGKRLFSEGQYKTTIVSIIVQAAKYQSAFDGEFLTGKTILNELNFHVECVNFLFVKKKVKKEPEDEIDEIDPAWIEGMTRPKTRLAKPGERPGQGERSLHYDPVTNKLVIDEEDEGELDERKSG